MRCAGGHWSELESLLHRYALTLGRVPPDADIPGSYWGAPEAGLVAQSVFARADTPVHSVLHETCHVVCMSPRRRAHLATDAGGTDLEECAVCYLQIGLAQSLYGGDVDAVFADMDAWGYTFRLGDARTWYTTDAADARAWLVHHGLIDATGAPTYRLRAVAGCSIPPIMRTVNHE